MWRWTSLKLINENNRICQLSSNLSLENKQVSNKERLKNVQLVEVLYRTKIINLKRDSSLKFSIDLSVGLMQEVEELNREKDGDLAVNEKYCD